MTTYSVLRTRISDELVNENLTTDQINNAIQSAIAHYQRQRYYFLESRGQTFATVDAQEFYTSSDNANIDDLSLIDELTITVNTLRYPLYPRTWEWIDFVSTTTATEGPPTDYCYYAQQIRLYPIPDQVYTIRISGLIRLATLSADGDSNAWTTDGEELIRNRAKWDLATNILHADDIAMRCKATELIAAQALADETTMRLASGRIRAWL